MTVRRAIASLTVAAAATVGVIAASPAGAAPAIRVVKVYYDSPGSDTGSNTSINGEYVILKNVTASARSLTGWTVKDVTGYTYKFPTFTLGAGKSVVIRTGKGTASTATRYANRARYTWNNDRDTAYLRNANGTLIHSCAYNSTAVDYKNC